MSAKSRRAAQLSVRPGGRGVEGGGKRKAQGFVIKCCETAWWVVVVGGVGIYLSGAALGVRLKASQR